MDVVTYWNDVVQECDKVAHTNPHPSEAGSRGPAGSSRAFAIVHLAIHDAYFGIAKAAHGTYLAALPQPAAGASPDAAVAAAAHATLSKLYPNQKPALDKAHLASGLSGKGIADGHAFGLAVANAILALRAADPGLGDDGYASSPAPTKHRPDPSDGGQGFHAPFYGAKAKCFAVTTRHTLDKPYAPGSVAYEEALDEVRGKGIAPHLMGTLSAAYSRRTPEETLIGIFWAYDGAAGLGTPPRLYNRIVRAIADKQNNKVEKNARLFALMNAAMGDAGVLAWDDKYFYDLWRPVLGIREHDASMGPTGVGGNALDPDGDPFWLPLGAPRTNTMGQPFTPPFPAYPSGHATFGAAALQTVRRFYGVSVSANGPDKLANGLEFVSEELDGLATDRGTIRPRHTRDFPDGLWQMIEENGRSRVYLGVHWVFDAFAVDPAGKMDLTKKIGGVRLGIDIANDIAAHGLKANAAAGARLP
jgi:vanadium chloroperoxidase